MLTHESRVILDYLNARFRAGADFIDATDISANTALAKFEIDASLQYLSEEKYFDLEHCIHKSVIRNPTMKLFHYREFEMAENPASRPNTFNISAHKIEHSNFADGGSISTTINNGNQTYGNNSTISQSKTNNIGARIDEIEKLISAKPVPDQEQLAEIIELLKAASEQDKPVSKGLLAKFSDGLKKHSDLVIAIGNWAVAVLTAGQ